MPLFGRRRTDPPPQPELGFEQALDSVLRGVTPFAVSGSVHFRRTARGCIVQVQGIAPLSLTTSIMRRVSEHLRDGPYQVRTHISATVSEPWMIAPGIERRTPPGYRDVRMEFDTVLRLRTWLDGDEGRRFRFSDPQWAVTVTRR